MDNGTLAVHLQQDLKYLELINDTNLSICLEGQLDNI